MASAAADRRVDVPFLDEFCADLALTRSCWRFPIQIGDLVEGSECVFRSPVALEAPSHAVRFGVINDLHMVHMTVTGYAANPSVHMDCMVKIDVVRCLMNTDPGNRIAGLPRLPDSGKLWTEGFDLRVAVHAGLGGGNIRVGGFFHSRMAVAAIHAELIHVEGVIKGTGLGGLVSHPGVFGSEVVGHSGNDASHHDRQADKNLDGQPVGGAGKNIGHVLKREWIKWDNNRKGNLMFRLGLKLEISG